MTYTWAGEDEFSIDHTGVEEKFAGKGFAKQLVFAGVNFARENNLKIIPLCPYAKKVFDKDDSLNEIKFKKKRLSEMDTSFDF